MVCGQARNALFGRDPALDRRSAAGYPEEKGPVFRKTGKEWNAWNKSAPTPKQNLKRRPKPSKRNPKPRPKPSKRRPKRPRPRPRRPAPKKPRESFFRRQRRELSDAWREIYCNSRARRIRTWQIAVFALLIVEVTVMAIALNPVYWIGTTLLVFWSAGQLFDRRPARHSVGAVVLYFIIAVMIGVFAVQELLGA